MRIQLLFIFFIASFLSSKAQIGFTGNVVIDNSLYIESPFDVFDADLDGDGDIDLLVATWSADKLVWIENVNGLGTDLVQHDIATNIDNPWGVHAADLDSDGDLDVLGAAFSGDHVIWYENIDGNANFVQRQFISAFEVRDVSAHDMDGDGDLDVVWSSSADGKIKWSRNTDGLGTFAGTLNVENSVSSLPNFEVVDVDGDGHLDVVSAWSFSGGNKGVSWYKNQTGSGLFSSRITIAITNNSISTVGTGDFDGDGDIDVAATISAENKVVWYENTDGLGTFSAEQLISDTVNFAVELKIVDFNGDGQPDIIVAGNDDDETVWFQNLGSGNFSSKTPIDSFLGDMRHLQIADFNGDGQQDFITSTTLDRNIKFYENTDGLGNFAPYTITKNIDGGKVVHAQDIDGDGDLDLLSASHWDGKVAWYENKDGLGDFSDTQVIISESANGAVSGAGGVVSVDIDGDGDNDVVASSSLDDDVVWFENTDGLGTFGIANVIEDDLFSVNKVYAEDIDGDGDMDVICTARGKIIWYENTDGQGTFGPQIQIESINNFFMEAIAIDDLDGDGDMDISAASSYGLLYFLNLDGQGTFGARQTIEDFTYDGVATKISDLDGDGDNDIVYSGDVSNSDFIGWSENTDGLGSFGNIQVITTIINNPEDLSVFDMDNDGDMDVISSSYQSTGISVLTWYENTDGQGDFGDTQQVIAATSGNGFEFDITKGDINQDGMIDIISINNFSDTIIWYGNQGLILANEITGSLRFDLLGDGCTSEDDVVSNVMLISEGSTTSSASFTQETGQFSVFTSEEGIINTQITAQLPNYYVVNPNTHQSNFTGFGNIDTVDFCIEPVGPVNDLSISVYQIFNDPRPGFDTGYRVVYRNMGTTQLNGSVSFTYDDTKLNFLGATETPSAQTANSLNFDVVDMNPFEIRIIDLDFNVFPPPTTNIDDVLVTTVSISPTVGDVTEDDNTMTIEQTVIGSYDPNDITVLQGEEILIGDADKYLNYLIRFQNTGTASAINVRVEHILDDKLDWTTMQLESLSHLGRVEILDGNNVQFIFDDIFLPDSTTDEVGSNGFIAFKIKPKSNVQVGDIISGVADIYFDFNPPIITNTIATEIVEPLSVDEFELNSVKLFPNPVNHRLRITSEFVFQGLHIVDINGRELSRIEVSTNDYGLDVSGLSKGIYFLEIKSGKSKTIKKFIKN